MGFPLEPCLQRFYWNRETQAQASHNAQSQSQANNEGHDRGESDTLFAPKSLHQATDLNLSVRRKETLYALTKDDP